MVCGPGYQLRLGVLLSRTAGNAKYVEEYARDMKKFFDAQPPAPDEPVLLGDLNDAGDVVMQELEIARCEGGTVHFRFSIKQPGDFFVFCSLNETAVPGELRLHVVQNPEEQPGRAGDSEIDYLKLELEEKAREEAERRREFLAAKKRQQEEEQRRAEEELRARVQARAEQTAKAFYMEKKLKELKDAEAKKQRLDMRTGGGFDLDKARLARQKTDARDSGPSTSSTFSKKDLPAPDTPVRVERDREGLEPQLSQYGGIADSEKPDEEPEPEFLRQDSELQQSRRPGSSGFRIKDVSFNRSSRPNSRFGEPRDAPEAGLLPVKSGLLESQVLYEHSKKLPVRANRTGDSFHPRQDPALDYVSGRELTRKLEAANRELLAVSQPREQLGSSHSNGRPFKLLPGSTRTDRGTSQDFGQRAGPPPEDKTAPKRQKGGFSLNKKPASHKLPALAPTSLASKQPANQPAALLGPSARRKVGK